MKDHTYYVNSFQKAPSISNEHYHPKTGKRLGFNEMYSYIEKDAEKRTNNIIKKVVEWTEQNVRV